MDLLRAADRVARAVNVDSRVNELIDEIEALPANAPIPVELGKNAVSALMHARHRGHTRDERALCAALGLDPERK